MTEFPSMATEAENPSTDDELKVHISRVPVKFSEETLHRILREKLLTDGQESQKITVELVYPREDSQDDNGGADHGDTAAADKAEEKTGKDSTKEHRGFGFVTFEAKDIYDKAIAMDSIKGGRKATSKKLHTIYLRPYTTNEEETNVCYLWKQMRCPYHDNCKFSHVGPGACLEVQEASSKKKKGKCFAYKKGKCNKGDDCPFSHDFTPSVKVPICPTTTNEGRKEIAKSEKDCINWKTKGKCRKQDKCPYRHDPELQKKALESKKRKREAQDDGEDSTKKEKQPLCIRVFGMAYDSKEEDIREMFQHCGKIQSISFPIFEDSGRSKGYCGVWFSSPKAVAKAIELDGQELHGRWLSIQAGKMYLRQWEENHKRSRGAGAVGE